MTALLDWVLAHWPWLAGGGGALWPLLRFGRAVGAFLTNAATAPYWKATAKNFETLLAEKSDDYDELLRIYLAERKSSRKPGGSRASSRVSSASDRPKTPTTTP